MIPQWVRVATIVGLCLPIASASADEPLAFIKELPGYSNRVLIWKTARGMFGIEQPATLNVAMPQGKLSLSFAHAGYTAEDPEGKNAILSITVLLKQQPLSMAEKQKLKADNILLDANTQAVSPSSWWLDIALPINAAEQDRIRKAAGLPLKIEGTATIPLQIKWKAVDGAILYDWLTNTKGGLQVIIKPSKDSSGLKCKQRILRRSSADDTRLIAWWKEIAKDGEELIWYGGSAVLVENVIGYGCIRKDKSVSDLLTVYDAGEDMALYETRLDAASSEKDGNRTIKRTAFLEMDWSGMDRSFYVVGTAFTRPSADPGIMLLDHPELVKDLTGSGVGLKAILGK